MASNATIVRRLRRAPDEDAARAVVRALTLAELEAVACWVAKRWTIQSVNGSLQLAQDPEPRGTGYAPVPHESGRERPDPVSVLSGNLRARRQALGLTQEQVADAGMMDTSYYSRIERSTLDRGMRMVARLARALHTTPAALLEGID
jgi:hypothetical protein